jgi:hypothetical protein
MLALNYRKRIENFIITMMEKPIVTQDYASPSHLTREDEPEKFIGDAQIYVKGFKHESDRIREIADRNQNLDFCPNASVNGYQFRVREASKEIHPEMRFKAKTALERIEQ